ncbi:hypothetical protein Taro_044794 [Colocasia esculenta]|uniref:Uncharacterized protein n=1 Tax=Colocasia esculenta TaxID=4460 RepID=A0A843WK67_COLES|nr:hypothetical protein [Colocasia esculenta]
MAGNGVARMAAIPLLCSRACGVGRVRRGRSAQCRNVIPCSHESPDSNWRSGSVCPMLETRRPMANNPTPGVRWSAFSVGARCPVAGARGSVPGVRRPLPSVLMALIFLVRCLVVGWIDLFSFRFIEFGDDGGPAAKELKPKFDLVSKHIHAHLGFQIAEIEMKHVIASAISVRAFGGVLFIFGSTLGANLLALYLAIVTPIVFDFYNYDVEKPVFAQLFVKFTQNLALFGALLFFLGMKTSVPRRTAKKKAPKTKTL